MAKHVKYHQLDKWDAHMVEKNPFIHSNLSDRVERFHSVYAYYSGSIEGSHGVQRRMWKAADMGWFIDNTHSAGKSSAKCPA